MPSATSLSGPDYLLLCALEHIVRQVHRSEAGLVGRVPASVFVSLMERGWMNQTGTNGGVVYFRLTAAGRRELKRWIQDQAQPVTPG